MQVVLVSKDKDYLQLVDDSRNIQVWMPEDAKNAEIPGKQTPFVMEDRKKMKCSRHIPGITRFTQRMTYAEECTLRQNLSQI